MAAVITFFPVGNGDMTLIELESGRRILIDINIRQPGDGVRDVAKDLRDRLQRDSDDRPYVDAMLLSHPDLDHCRGLVKHFHFGPLSEYKKPKEGEDPKIIIREMWSSPMVYRRASTNHTLSEDAKAWKKEAKRRVKLYEDGLVTGAADRIQIFGEDENGKTDNLTGILVKDGQMITKIDGVYDFKFQGVLLAPRPPGDDEDEERRTKNNSSVIVQFSIAHGVTINACKFLTGGDAEVGIWEKIWEDYKNNTSRIDYDLLQTPHHCSWHSLSYDSWGNLGEDAEVSEDARDALGQARDGAYIVASSKEILDDDVDPPCIRAEREYKAIAKEASGEFLNTATHCDSDGEVPMEFEVTANGPALRKVSKKSSSVRATVGAVPLKHG